MRLSKLLVIFALAAISTKAETFSGTVCDVEGAVIPGAHVIFHWDPSVTGGRQEDISVTTDRQGRFSVELKAGFYDVFVAAMSFSPHCEKIRLKEKDGKNYKVKLKLSPVTSKELD